MVILFCLDCKEIVVIVCMCVKVVISLLRRIKVMSIVFVLKNCFFFNGLLVMLKLNVIREYLYVVVMFMIISMFILMV